MVERRKHRRLSCRMKTVVTKTLPDRRTMVMEFELNSLSAGGVFIAAEDLSLFDLGEDLAVVIEDAEDRFYEGRARVVRSARVFSPEKKLTQSGYGLMFIDAPPEYLTRIDRHVAKNAPVIL
jgi:c-di-GMP-binding flagellar brake protein YcgR